MELLYSDDTYDTKSYSPNLTLEAIRAEIIPIDSNAKLASADIGAGADWPVVLVQIFSEIDWPKVASTTGPIALFFLGDKINKNLDAWLAIAQKLKKLFAKRKPLRVDAKVSLFIAIGKMTEENVDFSDFEVTVQVVEHIDLGSMIRTIGYLDRHPDATYQVCFARLNEAFFFVIGSDGVILFNKHINHKL
jgi:hypothetical protein